MKHELSAAPKPRFPAFLRHAHWATVALVVAAYATINARRLFERGSAERVFMVESHYLLGIVVLLLTVPRTAVRLRHRAPAIAPEVGLAGRIAAWTAHTMLFLFLLVQPMLGIATRLLSGKGIGMPLSDWSIPGWSTPLPGVAHAVEGLHVWIGEAFYYVIGAHVLAALWHWLVRRDNALQRML